MVRDSRLFALAALLAGTACNEPPLLPPEPTPPPVRDALFRRDDDGSLYLMRTDGSNQRRVGPAGLPAATPIALSNDSRLMALLVSGGIALATVEDPGNRQLVLPSVPPALGPSAFSLDDRYLAVPCVLATGPAVLIYDRSLQRWDTTVVGEPGYFSAPAFSPDNSELVGIGLTPLSMYMVRVRLFDHQPIVDPIGSSRLLNAPIFGWSRWVLGRGLVFLVRNGLASPEPDSLTVVSVDPDKPANGVVPLYSVLMAPGDGAVDIVFQPYSTYALSKDGEQVIIAAQPDSVSARHMLFGMAKGGRRVYTVLPDPTQFPIYPQLIN